MSKSSFEYAYPLSAHPSVFVGKKPAAVLFGDERVEIKTWRDVYAVIIGRCNENQQYHERLMYLRNKAAGKVRVFISDKPDGMRRPLKVDEGMFCEVHYGSETLMHILVNKILKPAGFNCHGIRVVLTTASRRKGGDA